MSHMHPSVAFLVRVQRLEQSSGLTAHYQQETFLIRCSLTENMAWDINLEPLQHADPAVLHAPHTGGEAERACVCVCVCRHLCPFEDTFWCVVVQCSWRQRHKINVENCIFFYKQTCLCNSVCKLTELRASVCPTGSLVRGSYTLDIVR